MIEDRGEMCGNRGETKQDYSRWECGPQRHYESTA